MVISFGQKYFQALCFKPELGSVYEVKVIKVLNYGTIVEYLDALGNQTFLQISELAWQRTENATDVVNVGYIIDVKNFGMDPRSKKEKVYKKALLPKPEGYTECLKHDGKSGGKYNRGRDNRNRGKKETNFPQNK